MYMYYVFIITEIEISRHFSEFIADFFGDKSGTKRRMSHLSHVNLTL